MTECCLFLMPVLYDPECLLLVTDSRSKSDNDKKCVYKTTAHFYDSDESKAEKLNT